MKTHKIVDRGLSSSRVWVICGIGIAILVMPRIVPLAANFLFLDDFIQRPIDYLKIHRFGSAAELAFWHWAYGPNYLRSYVPKLVSIGYITIGIWALAQILRAWKVPFVTALLAVLLFLVSPILTEYVVWNDISPENLAWVLVLVGYIVQLETSGYALAAGIALAFLALGFNQIVAGIPAMLVLTEATLLLVRNDENSLPWKRRLVWVALPLGLYAGYLLLSHYILGYSSSNLAGETKGLATPSDMLSLSFFWQRYHDISLLYLNVFQPLLSYFFGIDAALRGAWRVWALIVLLVPTTLFLSRGSPRALISCVGLLLAMLAMPSAFGWVLNTVPTGIRLSIGMLLAFSLWFVALSVILLNSERRNLIFANLGILALIISQVPVTIRDAKNRALGSEATKNLIESLKDRQNLPPPATAIRIDIETHSQRKRSGMIVYSFHEVGCEGYSIAGYQQYGEYLRAVLRTGGITLVSKKALSDDTNHRLTMLCRQSRAQQRCGALGVSDPISNIGAACFYRPAVKGGIGASND